MSVVSCQSSKWPSFEGLSGFQPSSWITLLLWSRLSAELPYLLAREVARDSWFMMALTVASLFVLSYMAASPYMIVFLSTLVCDAPSPLIFLSMWFILYCLIEWNLIWVLLVLLHIQGVDSLVWKYKSLLKSLLS